ncbi:MAG: peptidoglycan-binding protein [Candidatus Niyogibacteria bacterium]|nr:peptidoglycan-binding protein [Candidatus Niyogibacteria bacterium]
MRKWRIKIKLNRILFLLGLFLFLPFFTFADHNDAHTIEQLQTQIQALQAQLQKITGEIDSQTPAVSPACPALSYDLYLGLRDYETGGQISALQKFMAQDPSIYPEGFVTGYYGPLTEQAVKRFQSRYGLLSDSRPDGSAIVGQITRAKINEVCLARNLAVSSTVPDSDSNIFPGISSSSFVSNAIKRPDVYDYGPSIINDGGVYRMYWCSARVGGGDSVWYAQSSDGINWSNLRIVLNPTLNSEETDFESNGHICDPSVIKFNGSYYLYYTAASLSGVNNEIFLARSSDGINWTKYPSNSAPQAVIKNTTRSGKYGIGQSAVFFLNGKFYHYFTDIDRGGEMLAFSTDGINWTIQNNNQPVFLTTNFVPVYLKDYKIFFAAYAHNELNHNDLYYSFSKDGITWDPKTFSDSRKITISGNRGSTHNIGILTDIAGNVSGSSILVYYGAGDAEIVPIGGSFSNAGSWDIDISRINFSPPPSPSSPGSIQGFKLKMPGNQSAMPPGGETVRLDNSSPLTANPYFFTATLFVIPPRQTAERPTIRTAITARRRFPEAASQLLFLPEDMRIFGGIICRRPMFIRPLSISRLFPPALPKETFPLFPGVLKTQ